MYRHGQGVSENMEEAVKYYKLGAEQGGNQLFFVFFMLLFFCPAVSVFTYFPCIL